MIIYLPPAMGEGGGTLSNFTPTFIGHCLATKVFIAGYQRGVDDQRVGQWWEGAMGKQTYKASRGNPA